ncbi:hypothetical protein LCGC14_1418980, partial [marine sediment metagenome]
FVDQALTNRKGITWLDDCRIPYEPTDKPDVGGRHNIKGRRIGAGDTEYGFQSLDKPEVNPSGRFPANLLVSDDVLNDGRIRKTGGGDKSNKTITNQTQVIPTIDNSNWNIDSGSFSRYFDLDKWWAKTFPFLIVPKASKSEKNNGLDGSNQAIPYADYRENFDKTKSWVSEYPDGETRPMNKAKNNHPTVKPLKLMSYLITLGSRAGDIVLDPFSGSGTTLLASKLLNRKSIGIDNVKKYCEIAANRCGQNVMDLSNIQGL